MTIQSLMMMLLIDAVAQIWAQRIKNRTGKHSNKNFGLLQMWRFVLLYRLVKKRFPAQFMAAYDLIVPLILTVSLERSFLSDTRERYLHVMGESLENLANRVFINPSSGKTASDGSSPHNNLWIMFSLATFIFIFSGHFESITANFV